jgi:hypothetical protein
MIAKKNVKVDLANVTVFLASALAKTQRQLMRYVIKTAE